jgi:hypothetical protein
VDGADNIQTFTGLPRSTPSQEAASEFRVLNSTYLAESLWLLFIHLKTVVIRIDLTSYPQDVEFSQLPGCACWTASI